MVMAAAYLTVFLLVTGLAFDFGRAHLYGTLLQSAVDASSLAGALEVIPMVELSVPRWRYQSDECWDSGRQEWYDCGGWERTSTARISGSEFDLYPNAWWDKVQPSCRYPYRCDKRYSIEREWIVMPPSSDTVARHAFDLNAKWPTGSFGATVEKVTVRTNTATAEVTTTATLSTPTAFLKLIGIHRLEFTRTGTGKPVRR